MPLGRSDSAISEWTPVRIVGTSHVLRWRTAIKYGQVVGPNRGIAGWQGKRAQMLASDYFLEQDFANQDMPTLLVVPEFRLGNRSLVANQTGPEQQTQMDPDLITGPNDQVMYDATIRSLEYIQTHNPSCKFLFWSLAGREYSNRSKGKYMSGGEYRHPVWNLVATEEHFGRSVIKLSDLMSLPQTRLLYSDASMHPSWVGLELLRRLVDEPDAGAASLLREVCAVASKPVVRYPRSTILTGDSVWLKRLRSLAQTGLIGVSAEVRIEKPKRVAEAPDSDVVYISKKEDNGNDAADVEYERNFLDRLASQNNSRSLCCFFWEARARAAKDTGPHSPESTAPALDSSLTPYAVAEANRHMSFVHRQHVESSAALPPTLQGILKVVELTGGYISRSPLE